jgi:hypothetical protein
MTKPPVRIMGDDDAIQRLESLRKRHARLRDLKIRNEAERERNAREIQEAEQEAMRLFGTADVDILRQRIVENREANDVAVRSYEALITKIETEYDAIVAAQQG